MSEGDAKRADTTRRLAEAAAWRVRLAEFELDDCDAFDRWLSDPANAAAWRHVQEQWAFFDDFATSVEMMSVRRDALDDACIQARAQAPTLMESQSVASPVEAPSAAPRRKAWLARAAAVAVAIATAPLAYGLLASGPDLYRTDRGERRVITLADGSRVSLDAASAVEVDYSDNARHLKLLKGQARFDVKQDVLRPFSVQAGGQTVVATGTAFNVDLLGPQLAVTLIEGKVVILGAETASTTSGEANAASPPGPIRKAALTLVAGEQLSLRPAAPPKVAPVDIAQVTAWEGGRLVFKDEALSSVAARFSRYTDRPLLVDRSAADLRISGAFNADDVSTFVDTITRYLPVNASTDSEGQIILRHRA